MNLRASILSLVFLLATALISTASAADFKIGYVDGAVLLDQSPMTKVLVDKLEKEFLPRKNKLVAENNQLTKLIEKKQKDGAVMSESELLRLEKDIRKRGRELKNNKDAFNEDIALKRNQELLKIRKEIAELIVEVAKENKFDIILEKPSVIYASDRANITDLVLKKMKK